MISSRVSVLTLLLSFSLFLAACASAAPAEEPPVAETPSQAESAAPTAVAEDEEPAAEQVPAAEGEVVEPTFEPATAASGGVSFQSDILPIFDRSCTRCHGGNRTEAELDLRSYASLMTGSENGPVIVAGDDEASELITQVVTGEMPRRAPKLAAEQLQLLVDWVNQGALDN